MRYVFGGRIRAGIAMAVLAACASALIAASANAADRTKPEITYWTKQGIISPKLQLLSGHSAEQSLAVYRELVLSDVAEEYDAAMQVFPVR